MIVSKKFAVALTACSVLLTACSEEAALIETGDDRTEAPGTLGVEPANAVVGILPARPSPRHEYCNRNGAGDLVITMRNSGTIGSSEITGTVTYSTRSGDVTRPFTVPAVPASAVREGTADMPGACFAPDCSFEIQWSNQPPVAGLCIG